MLTILGVLSTTTWESGVCEEWTRDPKCCRSQWCTDACSSSCAGNHIWHETAHHPLLGDGEAECGAPSWAVPSSWWTLVNTVLPLRKTAIFYTTQPAGKSQKAQVALCSPWKPWCDHREICLQPQPGDVPCGFTYRSSMEYPLSADKHTAFLLDMCRSETTKLTFKIRNSAPHPHHQPPPDKFQAFVKIQRSYSYSKSTHLSRSENKLFFLPALFPEIPDIFWSSFF